METTFIETHSETQIGSLKSTINEGLESGIAEDFNPANHLKHLKRSIKSTIFIRQI